MSRELKKKISYSCHYLKEEILVKIKNLMNKALEVSFVPLLKVIQRRNKRGRQMVLELVS